MHYHDCSACGYGVQCESDLCTLDPITGLHARLPQCWDCNEDLRVPFEIGPVGLMPLGYNYLNLMRLLVSPVCNRCVIRTIHDGGICTLCLGRPRNVWEEYDRKMSGGILAYPPDFDDDDDDEDRPRRIGCGCNGCGVE